MAMKIRIGILSGSLLKSPTLFPLAWATLPRAQCQLIPFSQSLPFNAIQGPPERQGNSFRGLQGLRLAISVSVYLFFQMFVPHARMVHIRRLMDGEVGAGPGIGAIHLKQ